MYKRAQEQYKNYNSNDGYNNYQGGGQGGRGRRGGRGGKKGNRRNAGMSYAFEDDANFENAYGFGNTNNTNNNNANQYDDKNTPSEPIQSVTKTHEGDSHFMLSTEMRNYLHSCERMIERNEFANDSDRQDFIGSVLNELYENLNRYVTHIYTSKIIESLLNFGASSLQVRDLFQRLKGHYRQVMVDKYGSHVIETIFTLAPAIFEQESEKEAHAELKKAESEESKDEGEDGKKSDKKKKDDENDSETPLLLRTLVKRMVREIEGNWSEVMQAKHGSFALRTLLRMLAGFKSPRQEEDRQSNRVKQRKGFKQQQAKKKIDVRDESVAKFFKKEIKIIIKDLGESFNTPCIFTTAPSAVLQVALQVLPNDDTDKQELIKKILLTESDADERKKNVSKIITDKVGSHLMEAVLQSLNEQQYLQIYQDNFRGQLAALTFGSGDWSNIYNDASATSNHVVQQLINCVPNLPILKMIIKELAPNFSQLFSSNRGGVILTLITSLNKFKDPQLKADVEASQKDLMRAVLSGLELRQNEGRKEVVNRLVSPAGDNNEVNHQGCVILSALLKFNAASIPAIFEGFADIPEDRLFMFCTHATGSRLIEAFLESGAHQRAKNALIRKLKSRYTELALTQFGSIVLEKFIAVAFTDLKKTIVEELIANENKLIANHYGFIVYKKCRIEKFKKKADQWLQGQENNERKRKMFEDILEADLEPVKKSRTPKTDPKVNKIMDSLMNKDGEDGDGDNNNNNNDDDEESVKKNKKKWDDDSNGIDENIADVLEMLRKQGAKGKKRKAGKQVAKAENAEEGEGEADDGDAIEEVEEEQQATKKDKIKKKKAESSEEDEDEGMPDKDEAEAKQQQQQQHEEEDAQQQKSAKESSKHGKKSKKNKK